MAGAGAAQRGERQHHPQLPDARPARGEAQHRRKDFIHSQKKSLETAEKKGRAEGRAEGLAEGMALGTAEGIRRGAVEKSREAIREILEARFGSSSEGVAEALSKVEEESAPRKLLRAAVLAQSPEEFRSAVDAALGRG